MLKWIRWGLFAASLILLITFLIIWGMTNPPLYEVLLIVGTSGGFLSNFAANMIVPTDKDINWDPVKRRHIIRIGTSKRFTKKLLDLITIGFGIMTIIASVNIMGLGVLNFNLKVVIITIWSLIVANAILRDFDS